MQRPTSAPSLAGRCGYITDVAVALVAVLCILQCLLGLEGMYSTLCSDMGKVPVPDLRRCVGECLQTELYLVYDDNVKRFPLHMTCNGQRPVLSSSYLAFLPYDHKLFTIAKLPLVRGLLGGALRRTGFLDKLYITVVAEPSTFRRCNADAIIAVRQVDSFHACRRTRRHAGLRRAENISSLSPGLLPTHQVCFSHILMGPESRTGSLVESQAPQAKLRLACCAVL